MANATKSYRDDRIQLLMYEMKGICPARHESFLHHVMMEEYEKVSGFKPVIGCLES